MEVGDLVWHVDDISDGMTVPGLVVAFDAQYDDYVVVRFTDKDVPEKHPVSELSHNPASEEGENIMGNP